MAWPGPTRGLSAGLVALGLTGCANQSPPPSACLLPNQQTYVAIDLYFGRAIGRTGHVTDAQWARFVARALAPRFPNGFTVLDANGAWRDPTTGQVTREPSKLVRILAPPDGSLANRVQQVADTYRRDFAQQSVGIVSKSVCGAC
jgi:hypothetical protein